MWEVETVFRRCDSSQGGVKVVRNWFQLMERYGVFVMVTIESLDLF